MDLAHFWFQAPAGGGGYQIGNSLRFRGSSHLSFTPSSTASTRRQMTFSFWSKHDGTYNIDSVFASGTGGAYDSISYDGDTCSTGIANGSGGGLGAVLYPAARLRDPSAWRHYVMVLDTPNATAGDRLRIYINGERITAFASSPYAPDPDPGQNFDTTYWNTTAIHRLGATATSGSANRFFSGYLAEVHCVFGSALSPTDFGEYNADGVWVPKKVSGLTYGTNGFYLDFSDPADIGADRSGNGNNFTPTGFELTDTTSRNYDWMADGPTNNYSTWNPLAKNSGLTLANANLKANGADHYTVIDTIGFGPGSKIYAEVTLASTYNPAAHGFGAGITTDLVPKTSWGGGWPPDHWWVYNSNLTYYYPTSAGTFPTIFSANCVIQIAADYDTGEIWFGVNNVWRKNDNGTTTAPDAGGTANQIASYGGKTAFLFIDALHDSFVNCGQLPFKYTPPTGFEPLSTAELPAVAITNPSEHFTTILSDSPPIIPGPVAIGDAYKGGFYAGQIKDGNKIYNLIVAPVESGGLQGQHGGATPTGIKWKTTSDGPDPSALSVSYGGTAMLANSTATHPMFNWCVSSATGPNAGAYDATNAAKTGIGGYNDWYIPARNEMQVLYRNLKPDTTANSTAFGANPNAVPPTNNYTSSDPAQTSVAIFQAGGAQAFATSNYYWPATELSGDPTGAGRYGFDDGAIGGNVKIVNLYARAIRREFAYDAGILNYAQATFPNGLWWIKDRANTNNHQLLDSVRGGTKTLHMSTDNELATYTAPSGNSVAWCWNKGPYMDIVTWTGTGAVRTIPHSLGKVPGMIWIKNLEDGRPWVVYHKAVGNDRAMQLSQIDQQTASSAQFWNNTDPTTTEFSVGTHPTVNQAGKGMIAYVFPEVPGYSSFGKYVGNGSADGPFCYTGHRPALVMAKGITDSTEWITFDSARDPYNPCIHQLRNNQKEGEQVDAAQGFDLLSNGFKIRSSYGSRNASGQQYLWIAFAEHPFGGANVSPSPAR